jgi:hypothetical protein
MMKAKFNLKVFVFFGVALIVGIGIIVGFSVFIAKRNSGLLSNFFDATAFLSYGVIGVFILLLALFLIWFLTSKNKGQKR